MSYIICRLLYENTYINNILYYDGRDGRTIAFRARHVSDGAMLYDAQKRDGDWAMFWALHRNVGPSPIASRSDHDGPSRPSYVTDVSDFLRPSLDVAVDVCVWCSAIYTSTVYKQRKNVVIMVDHGNALSHKQMATARAVARYILFSLGSDDRVRGGLLALTTGYVGVSWLWPQGTWGSLGSYDRVRGGLLTLTTGYVGVSWLWPQGTWGSLGSDHRVRGGLLAHTTGYVGVSWLIRQGMWGSLGFNDNFIFVKKCYDIYK